MQGDFVDGRLTTGLAGDAGLGDPGNGDPTAVVLTTVDFFTQVLPLLAEAEDNATRFSLLFALSPESSESFSDKSDPPLSLSRISDDANFRDALGEAGGGRRLQTCT